MSSTALAQMEDNILLRLEATGYDSDRNSVISNSSSNDNDPFRRLDFVGSNPIPAYGAVSNSKFDLLPQGVQLAEDLRGGCGGRIWEAATVLIDYLLWKNKQLNDTLFKGQKVIELGAGTGLVGLAVALGCPSLDNMVLTDQIPMMRLMQQNIGLNNVQDKVEASVLDWGELEKVPEACRAPDVILASDCVYLEVAFKPLVDTLLALADKDTEIYMSYRKRRNADKRFFNMARKHFTLTEVMDDPKRSIYTRDRLKLYLMRKK
ncbi:putative methyltransferase-domain-containing protein [Zychaea mexicana]|uniref:putative methyltransferase-domain-containing protein n=1 Tax=Zychaea mexicana TaxID=64656 RepID=UPI0022FEE1D9|nr:putative methyltransferase-domain-containing protein [Zychaea mexicana]KAI9495872.1 putative methyltransferase-domain-containing protein [Zychaea mexicana]